MDSSQPSVQRTYPHDDRKERERIGGARAREMLILSVTRAVAVPASTRCSGKFSIAKLITYENVWRGSRVQNAIFRSLKKSISENHFQGKVTYAAARRGRMTFSRSERYVFLEPGKDEQFVMLEELKERLKGWLERWPEDLEMPVELTKFNNNLEDAVAHLVKFSCELEIGGGAGSLQWYEVDLE